MKKQLTEEALLKDKNILNVEFDGELYFRVSDVAEYLGEDLSDVKTVTLPLKTGYAECALIEFIKEGRKKPEKTDFDKKIIQALNFKPERKK